jgi:hypothetical protein
MEGNEPIPPHQDLFTVKKSCPKVLQNFEKTTTKTAAPAGNQGLVQPPGQRQDAIQAGKFIPKPETRQNETVRAQNRGKIQRNQGKKKQTSQNQ